MGVGVGIQKWTFQYYDEFDKLQNALATSAMSGAPNCKNLQLSCG